MEKFVDATGLACPMPLVRTKKAMDELESGEILVVHATDKGAKTDLTAWAKSKGHEVLEITEENDVIIFKLRKK